MSSTPLDNPVSKTFCALPWIHLDIAPSGIPKLCCISGGIPKGKLPMSLYDYSLEEIWNSEFMQEVRQKMIHGERVSACAQCYRMEQENIPSMRILSNQEWLDQLGDLSQLISETLNNHYKVNRLPIYYQFALSNLCNLACRMCCSDYSDKIASDPIHRQWSPIGLIPILPRWKENILRIAPPISSGTEYQGLSWIDSRGNYFFYDDDLNGKRERKQIVLVKEFAQLKINLDQNTRLQKLSIHIANMVDVPNTKVTVYIGDLQVLEKQVNRTYRDIEVDLSRFEFGHNPLRIGIRTEFLEDMSKSDFRDYGLPIEAINIHRSTTDNRTNFAYSRFSKDAQWSEQDSLLFGEFLSNSDELKKIHFIGGEPTLHKSTEDIIDFLIDRGVSKNISLQFNTNATIYNPRLLQKLASFKSASLALSIDSFGEHYEYIRYPAKWKTVADNLDKIRSFDFLYLNLYPTIESLNLMTITNLMRFCDKRDLLCNTDNHVYEPDYLSVFVLPKQARKIAVCRLQEYYQSPAVSEVGERNRHFAHKLADYIDSIQGDLNPALLQKFMLFTNDMDRRRGQDFKVTHTELFHLITEAGFEWTDESYFSPPWIESTPSTSLPPQPTEDQNSPVNLP